MTLDAHKYNPEEAIRIAETVLPRITTGGNHIFSSRYVLSNMRQMKEKADKWDNMMEKSMEAPYIDCVGNAEKLEAVKTWLTYAKAQGYISISQGEKLDEILEAEG